MTGAIRGISVGIGRLVLVPLAALAVAGPAAAQEDWKGMARLEFADPRIEQPSTLRVLRSDGDVDGTISDEGSILGWGASAATGTLEPRDKPGTTESLEIMRRSELEK